MPEGSLAVNIQTLQQAMTAISGLLGQAAAGGNAGSGLAGAAGVATNSPASVVAGFSGQFSAQLSGVFRFEASGSISGATDLFANLKAAAQAPPTDELAQFKQGIEQANTVFSGNFVGRIQDTLKTIRGISQGVPQDHSAIVSALLDQILEVLGSLSGPEAQKVQAWIESIKELSAVLIPLIEEARNSPDPAAVAIKAIQQSLDSTLEVFGFGPVKKLIAFLDGLLTNPLPQDLLAGVLSASAGVATEYGLTLAAVGGDYAGLRARVDASFTAIQTLKADARLVLSIANRIATAKILQPGALENFLRSQMQQALEVKVNEAQKIDDPFKALFDKLDAAIGKIDLSFVRNDVLGFFERTRDTIKQADIGSVSATLQQQLATVQGSVEQLQQGVADLLARLKAFFDGLNQKFRSLAENVGQFEPDGTFQFNFEQDLRTLFNSARLAVGGDPANPAAPSVAGTLNQFHTTIDQFLGRLRGLLQPVESAIDGAKQTVVGAIDDFSAFLQGLDLQTLMQDLQQKVKEVVDALVPIDFDAITDPVVAAIEENAQKLQSIDTESMNALLREALKVALDVVINIDFTATVSSPLDGEFAKVKQIPAQAIQQLQQKYKDALAILDTLNPAQLLGALFAAFDTIDKAVGSLNVATLLRPLDGLHEQHLQQPLAKLKPSVLIQPLSAKFHEATSLLDHFQGSQVIAPLNAALNQLKSTVTGFDIVRPIDDLLAAVERVKQDLRAIRPSGLLQPLVADFERLETELDRFKPSVVFQPIVEMAAPLLQFLEGIQQQTISALFQAFQLPLQVLDRLKPDSLTKSIQQQIDKVVAALNTVNLPVKLTQMKGQFFDLKQAAQLQVDGSRLSLVLLLDPEVQFGEIAGAYTDLIAALTALKQHVELPNLSALYTELQGRMLAMLPPYARELLDPETFKRVMRLADPTRFLKELDERFEALKNKLVPIRPQEIAAELDATYDSVLALVDQLDITASLNQVKDILNSIKGIITGVRVDFLAADIDRSLNDVRAIAGALDPARLLADLDGLHHEVELVVKSTLPSVLLSGLQPTLDEVKGIVTSVNPHTVLGPPLTAAWSSVEGLLNEIDFTVVLKPIVDKLDELELSFKASLQKTEDAFDKMLDAGKTALGGGGASVSVGVSI
jgi:hypothetical protein